MASKRLPPAGRQVAPQEPVLRRPGRPPATDSAETRRALLAAAVRCFARNGKAATTLRQVAAEAGVTQGTLYHYFPAKSDLYLAAYTWAVEEEMRRFTEAAAATSGLAASITAVMGQLLEMERTCPEIPNMVIRAWVEHAADREAPLPIPTPVPAFYRSLADRAVQAGELEPGDEDVLADVLRCLLWGIHGISLTGIGHAGSGVQGLSRLLSGSLLPAGKPSASGGGRSSDRAGKARRTANRPRHTGAT